eukprot:CAMPEP_0172915662 /NCGR_PEP_ID=MMETSP1075-20121228/194735_1 /TAXON_ID=2916 /ORGANISM="Ceratium fusus, Strain PA161109" /LENGTH=92 /DNA_ID=CAMNT_0013774775 /DNA_START=20 /DNA_END=294 /DNA_ORIENTATION=+
MGPAPVLGHSRTNAALSPTARIGAARKGASQVLALDEQSVQSSPAKVGLSMTVHKVDYSLLTARLALLERFRQAVKQAIVSEAGAGLTQQQV